MPDEPDSASARSGSAVAIDPDRQRELGYASCLRRLTAAPRTEHELRVGLERKGYDAEVVEDVLHQLRAGRLVNDELYASMWVESRARSKTLAAPILRAELRRKGVADDVIEAALAEIDDAAQRERARELVRRKLRGPVPDDRAERDRVVRRLGSMLMRKGFPSGVAMSVVTDVLGEVQDA